MGRTLVTQRYDDGGFTGGNLDRPVLQRLLANVDAQRIQCVVVYKVDRLSRSLLDFARLIDRFGQTSVSFVSVSRDARIRALQVQTVWIHERLHRIAFGIFERASLDGRLVSVDGRKLDSNKDPNDAISVRGTCS